MEIDYSELSRQRKALYEKLLDNSKMLLKYLDEVEEDSAKNLSHFLKLQSVWNICTRDINKLDQTLREHAPDLDAEDEEWRMDTLREIDTNLEELRIGLNTSAKLTGSDMLNVNNQRKVLNAYFGTQRNDQIPLYLDEKK
ncbi:hypothetical protein DFP94_10591 [Fontibacillus phaseoli]|uniref:FlgN protein n=1 Tax=Fontibacillus phaseoli TaxID=1416533 RepID=A0A369BCK8_9BACL|nr:hypothetical protein [Fontibacillus phaseoli]RCX19075.1 hypothetical protein DFP94_10591 [Fontibacillus phaseoli]